MTRSPGSTSSSVDTRASASATPFTAVTLTLPPPCFGSHSTARKVRATSFLLQSPYMAANSGAKRTRPGSLLGAGGFGPAPVTAIAVREDQLVPLGDMRAMVARLPNAELHEISSVYGHDAFLKENRQLAPIFDKVLSQPF